MTSQTILRWVAAGLIVATPSIGHAQETQKFELIEATIPDIHKAIQAKELTCAGLVEAYLARARAYNGVCTQLVTADGKPIPAVKGIVRAGAPLVFPTSTVAASTIFPNYSEYRGTPIDLGHMDTTASDPTVYQQYGLRAPIPDAGQLNALETINLRGERSVTCKGAFDTHPSKGPLPKGAPEACEEFRKLPDALERAAELDARYGANPPLDQLPMYCIPFAIKNWFDAKDMRGTGGQDVNYAMDVPKEDSPIVEQLRGKGAIIYAIANAAESGVSASGASKAEKIFPSDAHEFSTWGGQPCNPYDTTREPRGSSSGSGVSVGANLVTCAICEQGLASCKGPASRNNVVNLLTTKGITTDGGIHSKKIHERAGIHCRTVGDAARVLDALKGYHPKDYFTATPKWMIPKEPYTSFLVSKEDLKTNPKPLAGMRIAFARDFMVKFVPNERAISDQIDREVKTVLRDRLGADLVESLDPLYPDDPDVPNLKYTFQDAFAEILAFNVPEYFFQTTKDGKLEFAVPGYDVRTLDYMVKLALHQAPLSENINLRRISQGLDNTGGRHMTMAEYLIQRGDKRVKDWASFVANAKWKNDQQRAGAQNAIGIKDIRPTSGMDRVKMQTIVRQVLLKVMYENKIDAFVNPENSLPPRRLFGPSDPFAKSRDPQSCCATFTPLLGIPELDVPAGYNQIVYEPEYKLSADKMHYEEVSGTVESKLPHPMPNSLMLWAGPGDEPTLFKIASAYEAATGHRVPPAAFGPVPEKPSGSSR
jgi:Asp-tRNA(Asn)/Glu-tRNA(Gln) amidotransferase A subunit family amidase